MKSLRVLICLCVLLLAAIAAAGATYGAAYTSGGIFDDRVRTLTVEVDGARLAPPVISLNSVDRLKIGFDMLGEERDYLRYSIYHCNADWTPSQLVDSEVFDGFNIGDVTEYAFSRGTTTHYVHYTIMLPNGDFRFNKSGNYLLKVYEEDDPDRILLQTRFMVSEGAVAVSGEATSRTDIDYNDRHQQLSIDVDLGKYPVRDPFNDLKVVVSQNGRLDNAVMLTHPSRVSGSRLVFDHNPLLIFPGGNEYRRMETVLMQYPGMNVAEVQFHYPYYHHFLNTATPRYSSPYQYDRTQHGRYFVREYNSDESDVEADYSVVHFVLDMLPLPDKDVYIDGDFLQRRLDNSSKMIYDAEAGVYHRELLLKQGAYNFQYLAMPRDATHAAAKPRGGTTAVASTADVEGDFYQTENEYGVAVYYRAPGERYDRLIGYSLVFSGR